jgi:hypothetical protein
MRFRTLALWVFLVADGGAGLGVAPAAIPDAGPPEPGRARTVVETTASQLVSSRAVAPSRALQEVMDHWQRQLREHANSVDARMEELDRRTYEIVGRLQLLVGCLILLLLGLFLWLLELSRRIAALEAGRGSGKRADLPSRGIG